MEQIISTVFSEICIDYIVSNAIGSPIIYLPDSSGRLLTEERADTLYIKSTDYASSTVAGVVKVNPAFGVQCDSGDLKITYAENSEIDEKLSNRKPIVPATLEHAVKVGVTTNTEQLTNDEKANACEWLGAYPLPLTIDLNVEQIVTYNSRTNFLANRQVKAEVGAVSIPLRRGSSNNFDVGTPKSANECANKDYVDNLPDKLTLTDEQKAKWRAWLGIE